MGGLQSHRLPSCPSVTKVQLPNLYLRNLDSARFGGINGHITTLGHEPHNYVTVYINVDDVQTYLDKAVALGGKVVVPPVTLPQGQFAWFSDPDGNVIGLWKATT